MNRLAVWSRYNTHRSLHFPSAVEDKTQIDAQSHANSCHHEHTAA